MKVKFAALALVALFSMSAFADVQGSGSGAQSGSIAGSESNNAGNSQNITFTSPEKTTIHQTVDGTQTLKNTPSVSGPQLTTSNDTCMGSASGSANGPGFGIGFGKTYKDDNCVMLKNARELWNMGMKAAALARLCMDPDNRAALEITDFTCPQTKAAKDLADKRAAGAKSTEPTDPIVRRRIGLPVLAE